MSAVSEWKSKLMVCHKKVFPKILKPRNSGNMFCAQALTLDIHLHTHHEHKGLEPPFWMCFKGGHKGKNRLKEFP